MSQEQYQPALTELEALKVCCCCHTLMCWQLALWYLASFQENLQFPPMLQADVQSYFWYCCSSRLTDLPVELLIKKGCCLDATTEKQSGSIMISQTRVYSGMLFWLHLATG